MRGVVGGNTGSGPHLHGSVVGVEVLREPQQQVRVLDEEEVDGVRRHHLHHEVQRIGLHPGGRCSGVVDGGALDGRGGAVAERRQQRQLGPGPERVLVAPVGQHGVHERHEGGPVAHGGACCAPECQLPRVSQDKTHRRPCRDGGARVASSWGAGTAPRRAGGPAADTAAPPSPPPG